MWLILTSELEPCVLSSCICWETFPLLFSLYLCWMWSGAPHRPPPQGHTPMEMLC